MIANASNAESSPTLIQCQKKKNDHYNPSRTIPLIAVEDGITIIVVITSKDVRVTVYRKGQKDLSFRKVKLTSMQQGPSLYSRW